MPGPVTSGRWKRAASTISCADMSRPVYLAEHFRRIEKDAGEVAPPLMERAGAAAAELAASLLPDTGKEGLVLAGPGNNGGDAKIVARLLQGRVFWGTLSYSPHPPATTSFKLLVD